MRPTGRWFETFRVPGMGAVFYRCWDGERQVSFVDTEDEGWDWIYDGRLPVPDYEGVL